MDKARTYLDCIKAAASAPGFATNSFKIIIERADMIYARIEEIEQNSDKPKASNDKPMA